MEQRATNRHGFTVLYHKELADHLTSRRFQLLFLILLFIAGASLFGAFGSLSKAAQQTTANGQQAAPSNFVFLQLFTTAGQSIYAFTTFIGFLGPIFGIMLGFDAINNEQAQGTLNRLAAQPIYRDTIINAKFCAGATVVFLTMFALGGIMTGAGILLAGLIPKPEEIARLLVFLLIASVYISVWLAVAEFFSVVSKHAATAALACVAIWLFLTMFLSLAVNGFAGLVYPVSKTAPVTNVLANYRMQMNLNRISAYYLFNEATTMIMNPNVRSLNIMDLVSLQDGGISSYLSLGQSLLQIWPHLVGLIAMAVAGFAAAYISFMNREIRA